MIANPTHMAEVISIYFGQFGCTNGVAMWDLMCLEHGIDKTGELKGQTDDISPTALFLETNNGYWVPRCLFLDTDQLIIDQIRCGHQKSLHRLANLQCGQENSGGNWARGRYIVGRSLIDAAVDRLRDLFEDADYPQGVLNFYAAGGGTSGFASLFNDYVSDELYRGTQNVGMALYPSVQLSTSTIDPYNTILSHSSMCTTNTFNVMFDNETLYGLCKKHMKVKSPTYSHLNQLISQTVSSMTQSLRFDGESSVDLRDFCVNLIPYPRINNLIPSFAPLGVARDTPYDYSIQDITDVSFTQYGLTVECPWNSGKLISSAFLYRGDINPCEVNRAIGRYKSRHPDMFSKWCPNQTKIGMCYQPVVTVENSCYPNSTRSLVTFHNTTQSFYPIHQSLRKGKILNKLDSFKCWYTWSGLEESYLEHCFKDIRQLKTEYYKLGYRTKLYPKPSSIISKKSKKERYGRCLKFNKQTIVPTSSIYNQETKKDNSKTPKNIPAETTITAPTESISQSVPYSQQESKEIQTTSESYKEENVTKENTDETITDNEELESKQEKSNEESTKKAEEPKKDETEAKEEDEEQNKELEETNKKPEKSTKESEEPKNDEEEQKEDETKEPKDDEENNKELKTSSKELEEPKKDEEQSQLADDLTVEN